MLKLSIYLVVNFVIILLLCLSCSTNKVISQKSNNNVDFYNEVIGAVLDYHKAEHGYSFMKHRNPCYMLYPEIEVEEISSYYAMWHNYLSRHRKGLDIDHSFILSGIPGLVLDTIDLKKKVHENFDLSKVEQLGNQCIQYDQSKGKEEGIIFFSPIIKMNKEGYYHIALCIRNFSGFPEYFYIVKEQNDGSFNVVHHIWDDWPGGGIGGEIDILKQE